MTPVSISDELRYRLLSHLAEHPDASQRQVARELGISVGKVNYCLDALIRRGWLKVRNFKNSHNKSAYLYILTPTGLEEKIDVTYHFLRRKMAEYDALKQEIERLTVEVRQLEQKSE
jgi:EPS-associated MarR family transcriptional regulator